MSRPSDFESYPPSQNLRYPQSSSPTLVILTILMLVFFFTGLFLVYFWRCFTDSLLRDWNFAHTQSGMLRPSANEGLDPSLLQSFPPFVYSSVKDLREDKHDLECAICLLEFEDQSLVRMLKFCCHVFHRECVDLWFATHKTCPVCRRDLDLMIKAAEKTPVLSEHGDMRDHPDRVAAPEEDVRIDVSKTDEKDEKDDREEHDDKDDDESSSGSTVPQKQKVIQSDGERFSRSHSTGHSIVSTRREVESERREKEGRGGDSMDRHTLRLPEKVKENLLRGHHCTRSCSTLREMEKGGLCNCALTEVYGSSANNAPKS